MTRASRLQRELKKRSEFDSVAQEAWLNIVRTASRLTTRFERLFASFGLTGTQYNVLRILRGEGRPLPCLEIADRLIASVPGITGLVDRLEDAGLVKRERSSEDRRVIYVAITDEALGLLKRIDKPLAELHRQVMSPLGESEQLQLVRLLETLRAADEATGEADEAN